MKQSDLKSLVKIITKTLLEELTTEESATGAVAPATGKLPLQRRIMEDEEEEKIEESSVTGGEGYTIPAAFSKNDGGSKKALAGSNALGYELTPIGKKDLARRPDKMIE